MATALAPPLEFDSELTVSTSHRLQPLAKHSRELDIDEEPPEDDVNAKKPSSLGMDRERGERGNTGESYDSDDEYEVGEMGKKGYYRPEERAKKLEGRWWGIGTMLGFLVRHGCEARGIQPVSVEDRITLTCWSYLPQATLWAAANTNILTFSAGILGPELFNLPLKTCVGVIIGFNILAVLPVAYFATFGPKLGLRQMVMARYSFGFWPALVPSFCNSATAIGFMSLNAILGGQTLSLASNGGLSWSLGIVLVGIIGIIPSFLGIRALHIFSLSLLPISIIIFLSILGIAAPHLSPAISSPTNTFSLAASTTAGGVLGFGSTLIGFAATWSAFASDFTTYLPPSTPSLPVFLHVYIGLLLPLVLLQVLGAAVQIAAGNIESWTMGQAENGVGGLIGGVVGRSGGGRFLLVLVALNVVANVAPTIYSAGLSLQVCIPWLLRVPRYFLALLITAIYLPIALALSSHFSSYLSKFLYILSYWVALYLPPVIFENLLFRHPMTVGRNGTYDLRAWDDWRRLPLGYAAVGSWVVGVPCTTAGIAQVWWVGWAAQKINGGLGDIGFILGFCSCSLAFIPLRWLERRYTKK